MVLHFHNIPESSDFMIDGHGRKRLKKIRRQPTAKREIDKKKGHLSNIFSVTVRVSAANVVLFIFPVGG